MTPCPSCLGTGRVPGADNLLVTCPSCNGATHVPGADWHTVNGIEWTETHRDALDRAVRDVRMGS